MICRLIAVSLGLCLTQASWSLSCFFTLVKDSCWKDYDVSVDVFDANTGKPVVNVVAPKSDTTWIRQPFDCTASQSLNFVASFAPTFWEADKGKHFKGKRTWTLPDTMHAGDTAWNVTVCYPEEFSAVPLPPTASGNCTCDATQIPKPVAPKS